MFVNWYTINRSRINNQKKRQQPLHLKWQIHQYEYLKYLFLHLFYKIKLFLFSNTVLFLQLHKLNHNIKNLLSNRWQVEFYIFFLIIFTYTINALLQRNNIQKENESFQTFHKTMILKQLLLDCLFYDFSRIESKNVMNINRSFILYWKTTNSSSTKKNEIENNKQFENS